jgi:hypothetical protein
LRTFVPACLALALAAPCTAQVTGPALRKDDRVAIRIPAAAFARVRSAFRTWTAEAALSDTVITINGSAEWRGLGFSGATPLRVADRRVESTRGLLRVRFDRNRGDRVIVTVRLADTAFVLPRLFAPAADSEAVRAESYAAVGKRVFGESMDSIPRPVRDGILALADSMLRGDTARILRFEGKPYLQLRVPEAPASLIYDETSTSEAERVAGVVDELALQVVRMVTGILREHGGTASTLPGSFGFCIVVPLMTHKSIWPYGYSIPPRRHEVSLYVLADAVSRYAVAEITRQQLVDESVVMVKEKRLKIILP